VLPKAVGSLGVIDKPEIDDEVLGRGAHFSTQIDQSLGIAPLA